LIPPTKRFFSYFFLAVLVLNFSLVIPRTEWGCDCDKHPERMTCSCNCPKCVANRGGFLSYYNLSGSRADDESKGMILLKRADCKCGLGQTVLHLPNDVPFLTVQRPDRFPLFPAYLFKIDNLVLELDDFVFPHDKPG